MMPFVAAFGVTFQGVKIAGKAKAFTEALEQKGFDILGEIPSGWSVKGKICGVNSVVIIQADPNDAIVGVGAEMEVNLDNVFSTYSAIKDDLTKEYGAPIFAYDFRSATQEEKAAISRFSPNTSFLLIWEVDGFMIQLCVPTSVSKIQLLYDISSNP